jgi:hypothetical protein
MGRVVLLPATLCINPNPFINSLLSISNFILFTSY